MKITKEITYDRKISKELHRLLYMNITKIKINWLMSCYRWDLGKMELEYNEEHQGLIDELIEKATRYSEY